MFGQIAQYVELLGRYLRPHWPRVLLLAVLLVGGHGLELLLPQILRHFIDSALEERALRGLYETGVLLLVVGLVGEATVAATYYVGMDVAWRATNRLRSDVALHVIRLDMSFHNAPTPGELIERVDGDVEVLSNFFSRFVVTLVGGVLLAVGILVLLSLEDVRIGLAMLGFVGLYLFAHARIQAATVPFWARERQSSAELYGFLGERLPAVKDIQSSGASDYVMLRFLEIKRHNFWAVFKAWGLYRAGQQAADGVYTLGMVAALALGVYLFKADLMTVGTVYLIVHYIRLLQWPLTMVSYEVEDLQRARASLARVRELLATEPTVKDGPGAPVPSGAGAVEFDGVSFAYHPDRPVLRDVSFAIRPGRSLGLLGRTGSGKTTISRLLFRLYDAQQGTIRIGNADIAQGRLEALRRRIGLVTQEVQLFHASVRENLTLFDPSVSDRRIEESIAELGLQTWYESLPNGLDTELVAGGSQLSAGEAQLLAFTRVFLKDPDIVVLDEATSRLDPATEALIDRVVEKLLKHRTAMIIAHRLETVERVDDIVILDNGRVQESGPRRELAADESSRFARLLRTGLEEV